MTKWDELASQEIIDKTAAELTKRNITVFTVENGSAAFEKIKSLIPDGSTVMTGSSVTLNEIGFTEYLKSGKHPWHNLKDPIMEEKDIIKQGVLRRQSVTADYYLGSVHAVTQAGQILVASGTGSQLPAYAYSSPNVIWVVGSQKITINLDDAMERLNKYVFPKENERMKEAGFLGAMIGKLLIIEREMRVGRTTLILVKEKLGF
jgi:hypothetical protein